jgi:CheY-like chemotaxis protein
MVAEDNEVNQIVFTQILEDLGVNYQIVDNGGSAWNLEKPSPGDDPDGCLHAGDERASGHPGDPQAEAEDAGSLGHTPIVGVTAHALTGDMERCLRGGHG